MNIISSCKKHKTSKDKLSSKLAREKDIASRLKNFDTEHHPVGETLPLEQRLKVLKTFLKAAIPQNLMNAEIYWKNVLERENWSVVQRVLRNEMMVKV